MEEGKPAYIKKATLPSESATSAQGNRLTIPGGATLQTKNTNYILIHKQIHSSTNRGS